MSSKFSPKQLRLNRGLRPGKRLFKSNVTFLRKDFIVKTVVRKIITSPANDSGYVDFFYQYYPDGDFQHRIERHEVQGESDFFNKAFKRESFDNGKTWGKWQDVYKDAFQLIPGGEQINHPVHMRTYNPKYDHVVSTRMERIFLKDHHDAYDKYWNGIPDTFFDHSFLDVRSNNGQLISTQMLRYEDGPESGGLLDMAYCRKNGSYSLSNVVVCANGDILFPMSTSVRKCCEIAQVDLAEYSQSCPDLAVGVMIVRGSWNEKKQTYDLVFSKPIIVSDLISSRGLGEPAVMELANGRIIVVMRGSNTCYKPWNTRIAPGTPGYKFFSCSDDGGKTFSPPMPWYFDNREVLYSSASISYLFRSLKNNRCYWVGNITDPVRTDGNFLRWPLCIVEVDECSGILKKDTLTVIDTRQEGESDLLQLSNFFMLHDRETLHTELYLAKIGQYEDSSNRNVFKGDCCKYLIDWEA